ncbi:hypothetical protein NLJ89_g10496 [Agrocybe chaxingu]|uniref:mRNA 3'-end-processing protein RNA14 n=1 Tax=Agrocybe chaxingu TaxID=84603 RepID=A0A9W8MQV5_9AGAR|nr:hypothetical protein NLJ89_g10496 [Agrocybe chaxingu]
MSTSVTAAPGDKSSMDYADQIKPSEEVSSTQSVNSLMKVESQAQLPPRSEYEILKAQLAENPRNPEAWQRLVDAAEASREMDKISETYDVLLDQYPNTAVAQMRYINHFLSHESTFDKAEELFKKFLKPSPCVELWGLYLTYVRRLNPAASRRDIVKASYEFALNHVGQDKDSGSIWADYLEFLKSGETATTWEEEQKVVSLRKAYHRAVQIPLENAERLWRDLEAFEMGVNKITAKKFMYDLCPAQIRARTVLQQLKTHLGPLNASNPRQLYLPLLPKFDTSERTLVSKWKAYLRWEESNPLGIEDKDQETLFLQLQGIYQKAITQMRYYPEIWFMAYTWMNRVGKHNKAVQIIKAGLEANPSSYSLTFAYAEVLEIKKDIPAVHELYKKFLNTLQANLDLLEQSQSKSFLSSNGSVAPGNQPHSEAQSLSPDLQKHRTEYGLVWIMYMRFGQRAEGVKSLRGIFGQARKQRWTPWEVYEAAAMMEYHCSKDTSVASRIFEKGLDCFRNELEFVLCYLGFLISINNENNARALFEQSILTFPPEQARPLWDRWACYEYQYGDLEASLKLEKRMAEVYASGAFIVLHCSMVWLND